MSTFYLLDQSDALALYHVVDVMHSRGGTVNASGTLVVKVPDGIPIAGDPRNMAELSDAKRAGIESRYSGYARCIFEPCISEARVDLTRISQIQVSSGGGGNHCAVSQYGRLVTTDLTLDGELTSYLVLWEAYVLDAGDTKTGRLTRVYTEMDPWQFGCRMFFGQSDTQVTHGAIAHMPSPGVSSVRLSFENATSGRLYLGSWAFLYNYAGEP